MYRSLCAPKTLFGYRTSRDINTKLRCQEGIGAGRPIDKYVGLLTVGPKCTLAASHAAPWWVTVSMPTGQTDGRTRRPLHYVFRYGRGQRNNSFQSSLNIPGQVKNSEVWMKLHLNLR